MNATRIIVSSCALAAITCAQTTISDGHPIFGSLQNPLLGATFLGPPGNDTEHNIVTTIGNILFPAGNVRVSNNGVVVAGVTSGDVLPVNSPIPASGFPVGFPPGTAAILPLWDDLLPTFPTPPIPSTTLSWKEQAGVLHINWQYQHHCCPGVQNADVSFEIRVFAAPALGAPCIQMIYWDSDFSITFPVISPQPCDDGSCATIGYLAGSTIGNNVQWSFNSASLGPNAVLSIFHNLAVTPSSPLGPGSIRIDFGSGHPNGSYFLAVTANAGVFPNGWLFGLDIGYAELAAQLSTGFPFTGPLDSLGEFGLGPFQGVPPISLYVLAFGFTPASSIIPALHSFPVAYTIP